MNLIEKANIIHFHQHRISAYQNGTVKALGWKGEESQRKRFEIISSVGDFTNCSILDVGCGYGGLKAYLDQLFSNFTYLGIDLMPEFIREAEQLYKNEPNTHFLHADFTKVVLPQLDYVIASGAFGYLSSDPDFYFDAIVKLYSASKKTFVFNMLDKEHFPDHPLLKGHDRKEIETYCQSICKSSKVIDGYLEDDFTVIMVH
jgi:trans-aconitate methyltransferase